MKNFIVILLLSIFFNSCETDNASHIKFDVKSIKFLTVSSKDELCPKLEIDLSSKSNIADIAKKERSVSSYIFCPLSSNDFSPKNISREKYKLYGAFPQEIEGNYNIQDSLYNYSLSISFVDEDYNILNQETVTSIISEKDCIDCKLVFGFFPKRIKQNTFSDAFCIPVDIIKNEIKESTGILR